MVGVSSTAEIDFVSRGLLVERDLFTARVVELARVGVVTGEVRKDDLAGGGLRDRVEREPGAVEAGDPDIRC